MHILGDAVRAAERAAFRQAENKNQEAETDIEARRMWEQQSVKSQA